MEDIFIDSKLKIRNADWHTTQLRERIIEYKEHVKIIYEPIINDKTSVKFILDPDISKLFALIIGDVVHNLRSALDILICTIGRKRNYNNWHKLDFPFSNDLKEFNEKIKKNKYKKWDDDIVKAVRNLKPYKNNGDRDLYGLHILDVVDKHRLVLPTVCAVMGDINYQKMLNEQGFMGNILHISDGSDRILQASGEIVPKDFCQKYIQFENNSIEILFSKDSEVFSNQKVVEVLCRLGQMTANICEDFEKKFG